MSFYNGGGPAFLTSNVVFYPGFTFRRSQGQSEDLVRLLESHKTSNIQQERSPQTVPSPPLDPQVDNGSLVSGWPGSANTATPRVDENEFQYYLPIGHIGIPDFV